MVAIVISFNQFQIFKMLSHDPVATAVPSSVTPRQLTRLSCPARTPACSEKQVCIHRQQEVENNEQMEQSYRHETSQPGFVYCGLVCTINARRSVRNVRMICFDYQQQLFEKSI